MPDKTNYERKATTIRAKVKITNSSKIDDDIVDIFIYMILKI